jgi:hypothetical protein
MRPQLNSGTLGGLSLGRGSEFFQSGPAGLRSPDEHGTLARSGFRARRVDVITSLGFRRCCVRASLHPARLWRCVRSCNQCGTSALVRERFQLLRSSETGCFSDRACWRVPTGSQRVRSPRSEGSCPTPAACSRSVSKLLRFSNRVAMPADNLFALARGEIPRARFCLAGSCRDCSPSAIVALRLVLRSRRRATLAPSRRGLRHRLRPPSRRPGLSSEFRARDSYNFLSVACRPTSC